MNDAQKRDESKTSVIRLSMPARLEEAYLVVIEGPDRDPDCRPGQLHPLGTHTSLGRMRTNRIVLDDPRASREHCAIELRRDGYHLVDAGSINGTQVSGKSVRDIQLNREDIITIGEYRFMFWQGEARDPALCKRLESLGIDMLEA